jgi:outer membrane protein TolC
MRILGWKSASIASAAVLCLLLLWPAHAEDAPIEQSYDAPAFAEEGGGVTVLKAAELTLAHDPNLLLSQEDLNLQGGVVQELSGAFDWVMSGQLSWEHREQELRGSTKAGEQARREQLADGQFLACGAEDTLTTHLAELQAAQTMPGVDFTTNPGFNAQISLLERLIDATAANNNQAAADALEESRANLIETEISGTEELLGEASLGCQRLTDDLARIGDVPEEEEFDSGRLNLRFQKFTRSGLTLAPFLNGSSESTNFIGKQNGFFVPDLDPDGNQRVSPSGIPLERQISFGGKDVADLYTFELGFEVNVPLLRNRGRAAVAAGETAAGIDYDATELFLAHTATESTLNTSFAYWNLVAAQASVAVLERSVELQNRVVELTRDLIEADQLPASDLPRGLAGQANAYAGLENARRDVVSAQAELLRAMGVSVADAMPVALDDFPAPPSARDLGPGRETELIRAALANRLDLSATRALTESGLVLARAAFINLKPKLNLAGKVSSFSRAEESFSDGATSYVDPSYRLALAFEKPFANNAAKGRLAQEEAAYRRRQIEAGDLDRLVRIGVARSLASLREAVAQLAQAEIAADSFLETVRIEIEKLEAGETTLIDTILTEQQGTRAYLSRISAQLEVILLTTELRFESGTLVQRAEGGANRITVEDLTTVPGGGE